MKSELNKLFIIDQKGSQKMPYVFSYNLEQQGNRNYPVEQILLLFIIMSLFIIGSVSRITSNIVHQLAKNKQYAQITIADLLPSYEYHHRFYRVQRQLENLKSDVKVSLDKLNFINDLQKHEQHDDVLFVTHDYYTNVISKTKLMEHTANICKNRKYLYFATPVEYDHFGFANPEENYNKAENKVRQINPNATFIRSDVQDRGQALAYFNSPKKNFIEQRVFDGKFHFSPKIVKSSDYSKVVSNTLSQRLQGKRLLFQGAQNKDAIFADHDKDISSIEYNHAKENIVHLAQKYNSVHFTGYQRVSA